MTQTTVKPSISCLDVFFAMPDERSDLEAVAQLVSLKLAYLDASSPKQRKVIQSQLDLWHQAIYEEALNT